MTGSPDRLVDPIAMEVFSNRLFAIVEDVNATLIRSSFSTNIKERRDCSVGVFDGDGRLLAQTPYVAIHLGSLTGGVEAVLREHPRETLRPGDAFLCNDPYLSGGTHLPDVTVITPVFCGGALRFWVANIGHHSDFGGSVPGSISGTARTIFEEGLRLPCMKLAHAGAIDAALVRLIAVNTRDPEERELDLRVQVAANQRGAAALQDLERQLGAAAVAQAQADLLRYTATRVRRRIADLADGDYGFTSLLDDDGMPGGDPVPLTATVRVRGDRLEVDFAGTGPQARGAMNVPESALHATVYYAVKALLDPELPANAGMFEAITVTAPEGSILRPRPGAAVGARSITCQKLAGTIFGAFRGLLPPERCMASGNDVVPAIVFSGPLETREGQYVYLETIGGGGGARADADGMEAIHVHMTNTSNLPVEALENEYALHVDAYALVPDSGGAGTFRGGLGIARQIRARRDGTIFSVRSDSHTVGAPAGIFGGHDGARARLLRNPGTADEAVLPSKASHVVLAAGESIRIETPGGAGYGPPDRRDPARLAADLRGGKLGRAAALRDYGAALVAAAEAIDAPG